MKHFITLGLFLFVALGTNAAVWTTVGTEELFNNLDEIEFQNVQLPATGAIKLAPTVLPLLTLEENAVWQIVADRKNTLYLGTGDQAKLFRYSVSGKRLDSLWSGAEGAITALTTGADGTVYWGTTPEGNIYRLYPGAGVELLTTTEATFIFALSAAPDRSLLCATGPEGKLFRVFPDRRKQVLFTAPQAHLTTLHWLKEGKELLIGTSPDGIVYRLTIPYGFARASVTTLYDTPLNEIRALASDRIGNIYIAANPDDNSQPAVFCVDTSGILRWKWNCPDSVIFNIHYAAHQLYVLTGNRGIVYSLDSIGNPTLLARLDARQLIALLPQKDNLYIGTGNPCQLYRLFSFYADSGFITSLPFDLANPARFGRLDHFARIPTGTEIAFATRSGNAEKPDSTWSPWQPATGKVNSPPGRFLQWRANLFTRFPNVSPELERVDIYYAAVNRPPLISQLEIAPLSESAARKGNAEPRRTVSWSASDPDGDSLTFQLFILPADTGAATPKTLGQKIAQDLTETRYELDTRTLPDGWYRLRLVASDCGDRPATSCLTSERLTPIFLIDNTPPQIVGLKIESSPPTQSTALVQWKVIDALSPIVACRISLNAGPWLPLEPRDGIFDSPQELFSHSVSLAPGTNTIAIWAVDASGNSTTARTFFNR